MRFRLVTIAYVFALLAAGMALFSMGGIVVAAAVVLFWYSMRKDRGRARTRGLVALAIVGVFAGLFFPATPPYRRAISARNHCLDNLKTIALALEGYHAAHGKYPPAFVADAGGTPTHSWRVLILPYLGYSELHQRYSFDEPWDGPRNRKLWDLIPEVYQCPGRQQCAGIRGQPFGKLPANATHYFAVVGDETIWPPEGQVSKSDIIDGLANTIAVIEHSGATQPWTAPVDQIAEDVLELCDAMDKQGHIRVVEDFFSVRLDRGMRMAAVVDGSWHVLGSNVRQNQLKAMLTIAGGEEVIQWDFADQDFGPEIEVVRWDRVYATTALAMLVVLPAFGMLKRRRVQEPAKQMS